MLWLTWDAPFAYARLTESLDEMTPHERSKLGWANVRMLPIWVVGVLYILRCLYVLFDRKRKLIVKLTECADAKAGLPNRS